MTALTATTQRAREQMGRGAMPESLDAAMYTGETFRPGSLVCVNTAHGYAVVGSVATTLIPLGVYVESDAKTNSGSSGAKKAKVSPGVFYFRNSADSDAIAAANVGAKCYIVDDNTVALTDGSGTRSQAGTIIEVDDGGVWVCVGPYPVPGATYVTLTGTQTLTNKTLTTPTIASFANANHTHAAAGATGGVLAAPMATGTTLSFGTAGTTITVTATNPNEHFMIPALNAASYIVLSRTGPARGWRVTFTADGAQGAYAAQYFDGTTGTAISTSTTASKRHIAQFVFDGTNWAGSQFSSP